MNPIYVEWKDHHSISGWHDLYKIEDTTMLNASVGFLVKETDDYLILAQTYIKSIDSCGELLYILKNNIVIQKEIN